MNLFKIDTHVHTRNVSWCATVCGRELVHMYKDYGYDGIVITDHFAKDYSAPAANATWAERVEYFLSGYREAYDEGRRIGLAVILGMELRFTENINDYLVYGFDESFLEENVGLFELGLAGFRELIKDRDILIYHAHPFRTGMTRVDPPLLDGIEVFNGNPRANNRNGLAYEFAKTHGLLMLSGSDFHQVEDLGMGGIVLPEPVATPQELVRSLRENRILELIEGDGLGKG